MLLPATLLSFTVLQARGGDADAALAGGAMLIFQLVCTAIIAIPQIAGMWAIFTKAGQPGWAAIVPIYNIIVLLEITGKPVWWVILFLCPCVNIIVSIIVAIELANRFGQGGGFAVGLILLPFIFYPILGFGQSRYTPPGGDYYGDEDRPRRRRPPRDEYDEDEDRPRRPRRPPEED